MTKEELINLIYTLPDSFKPEIEKFLNKKLPEEVFVWRLQKLLSNNEINDKTFRAIMQGLGYQNFRANEWSKNPSSIYTHEALRDLTYALTAFVGGLAIRDAISKSESLSSDPNYDNDANAINVLEDTGAKIGDSQSKQQDTSNWFDTFLNSFKTGASESFNNFGSNLFSTLGSIGSILFSNSLNRENMEYLIDKQNAYNTPANQMQRFADAGLNPNLIYGLGSNGNQPASGSIAPVDFDTAQRENRMAKFQMALQAKQAEADIAQKQALTNLYGIQAQGVQIENDFNAQTFNERVQQISANLVKTANETQIQSKEIENWDDYRAFELAVMKTTMYANMMSGRSIVGKSLLDIKRMLKGSIEQAQKTFPSAAHQLDYLNNLVDMTFGIDDADF